MMDFKATHRMTMLYFVAVLTVVPLQSAQTQPNIPVKLSLLSKGLKHVTNLESVPGHPQLIAVTKKSGQVLLWDLKSGKQQAWLQIETVDKGEQGLLGIAFHPQFTGNGQFLLHYSSQTIFSKISKVELWKIPTASQSIAETQPSFERTIMEVKQPYANHNAGQLAFGPDGFLYIGWGDGGSGGDPHDNGQNTQTLLGSMLRIDIDKPGKNKGYGIPQDNPFVNKRGFAPEIWAWGLRNPWRFSFDSKGRLWVADVGQNAWEEISWIRKGKNYGWNIMEANHCYKPKRNCNAKGLEPPVHEYSHDWGRSITGGYEYTGTKIPKLKGKYVFGDFVSGRIWALDIDQIDAQNTASPEVYSLGQHKIMISTFGKTSDGEILVADFSRGRVYRIDPK